MIGQCIPGSLWTRGKSAGYNDGSRDAQTAHLPYKDVKMGTGHSLIKSYNCEPAVDIAALLAQASER